MKFKKLAKVISENENILIKENGNIEYRGKLEKLDKTDIKKLGEYTVISVRPMVVSTSPVVYLGIELLQIGEKPVNFVLYYPQTMTPRSFTDPFAIQPEKGVEITYGV